MRSDFSSKQKRMVAIIAKLRGAAGSHAKETYICTNFVPTSGKTERRQRGSATLSLSEENEWTDA